MVCADSIDLSGDGGVLKEILQEGEGHSTPGIGDEVSVHYVGTLESDGTQFDSSVDRGEMFQFTLGKGQVIKAWDLGVATMKRNEKCRLTCKSEYAYGSSGSGKIPADATLVFEIELFSWRGEDLTTEKNGGIVRSQLVAGSGQSPTYGSTVVVNLNGSANGKVFDARELVTFVLGEGYQHDICPGVEQALEKFTSGEKSRVTLASTYAFSHRGCDKFGVPADTTVDYEIQLVSFEKLKDSWSLSEAEKVEQAELFKNRGSQQFHAEHYLLAEKSFKKVLDLINFRTDWSEEDKSKAEHLELGSHLNLSMCYMRAQNYVSARDSCDKALGIDADNVKALYRRSSANFCTNEPDKALVDIERLLKVEPENKAAILMKHKCLQKISELRKQEKQLYTNMFSAILKNTSKLDSASNNDQPIDHFKETSSAAGDASNQKSADVSTN